MPPITPQNQTLKLARRRQGVTGRELVAKGIYRQALTRLVASGQLCAHLPRAARNATVHRGVGGMNSVRDGLARSVQLRLSRHALALTRTERML